MVQFIGRIHWARKKDESKKNLKIVVYTCYKAKKHQ